MKRGGCFDAEVDAWFAEMEAHYGNRPEPPLDAEAVLIAYEARYGKEAAEWERRYLSTMSNLNQLGRLDILQRALRSGHL